MVARTLTEVSNQCQAEGWVFNTEYRYPLTPNTNNEIPYPENVLQLDLSDSMAADRDVIKRNGKLYDKLAHSYTFTSPIECDVVWKFPFEDLPHPFKQYITFRAAKLSSAKMVADPDQYKLLQEQESVARATCMEYECNQGDYNYLGNPRGTSMNTYRPYQALIR